MEVYYILPVYFACIDSVTLGSPIALLFYPMLFFSAGVPGGKNENYTKLIPSVSDYIWLTNNRRNWRDSCSGWNVHNICIVSSGDLHRLAFDSRKPVFFHNKFFMERDRTVMDCAENVLLMRNREEYRRDILVKWHSWPYFAVVYAKFSNLWWVPNMISNLAYIEKRSTRNTNAINAQERGLCLETALHPSLVVE